MHQPMVDPTLDLDDGSQAITVVARLGDAALSLHVLARPDGGRIRLVTGVLLGAGIVLGAGGLVALALGAPGTAALQWSAASGLLVVGLLRRREERRPPQLTVGAGPDVDIPLLSPAIPAPRFPLIRGLRHGYELLLGESMTGEVVVDGRCMDLGALAAHAAPVRGLPATWALPIPREASITLHLDDCPLTLLVRSQRPARHLAHSLSPAAPVDRMAALLLGLSGAAHLGALALVASMPPAPVWGDDVGRAPVVRLLTARTRLPPPRGAVGPLLGVARGSTLAMVGSVGPAARGRSGLAGHRRGGLYALRGPRNNPDPHLARSLAAAAATREIGILAVLRRAGRGAGPLDVILGGAALDRGAADALDTLALNQLGEAYGVGGLGVIGRGRGGGGQAAGTIASGALRTVGRGGGQGGYGRIGGGLGTHRTTCIRDGCGSVIAGHGEVRGSLDREIIRRAIRKHINEVRYCYEVELQTLRAEGRVAVDFVIGANGLVSGSRVHETTLHTPGVEDCLLRAVRRWTFPAPKGGGVVVVRYPFRFRMTAESPD